MLSILSTSFFLLFQTLFSLFFQTPKQNLKVSHISPIDRHVDLLTKPLATSIFEDFSNKMNLPTTRTWFDFCSSRSTKHSHPAAMPKLPLRILSNAELLFSYKTHQSILQAPFSFPPPSKTQKVRIFGSKSSSQTIANRQEASFYAHQASNIRYCIIKTHLILLVFVLGSSIFRRQWGLVRMLTCARVKGCVT